MRKILCFQLKSVCYDSYHYFMNSLASTLKEAHLQIEFFDSTKEPLEQLERLLDKTYDAMFDFNSDLPKLKMDDDTYFLDHINAPFYDIILDHPLYHHDMLKQTLKDFHVLCLDENHKTYIETYYPHIKSVAVTFLTGETAQPMIPFEQRPIDLLFPGTYTPSQDIANAIDNIPPFLAKDTKHIIDLLLKNTSMTIEEAVKEIASTNEDVIMDSFALHTQAFFLADSFVRSYERERLIVSLLDANIPITVCGHGWESAFFAKNSNLTLLESRPFFDTFSLMGQSKMVLNLMPNFKNGTHDRIFSSMLNGCVAVTDTSIYLSENFSQKENILFYSLDDFTSLANNIIELLEQKSLAASIAQNGFQKACTFYTWKQSAQKILNQFYEV